MNATDRIAQKTFNLEKYINPKTFKQQLAQIQSTKKPHLIKNAAKKDLLKSYFLAVWLDTLK